MTMSIAEKIRQKNAEALAAWERYIEAYLDLETPGDPYGFIEDILYALRDGWFLNGPNGEDE